MDDKESIVAVTDGRSVTSFISIILGLALSVVLLVGSIKEDIAWVFLLGCFFGVTMLYFFINEFINHREILVENSLLTARVKPIPIFEKYDKYELERVRYSSVMNRTFSTPRGGGSTYLVGLSIRGKGKGLIPFVHAKDKNDAKRLVSEINEYLRSE